MSEIIPAILAKSVSDLDQKFTELPAGIKCIHIDVLEQDFWINSNVDFEVHLMVARPDEIVGRWVGRRAKRIIVHSLSGWATEFAGVEIGLGVELNVPLEEIFPLVLQADFVHLMSIGKIGEQGHSLDERIFDRIKVFKQNFPETTLSVDGGINVTNYQTLVDLGVERLVVGSGFKDLWKLLTRN